MSARPADRAWDDDAAGWHHHRARIRHWLRDATQRLLDAAGLVPGAKVLDVAAGSGDQTHDIVQRVGAHGEVWVTDVSARSLALAQAELRHAAGTRLHFRVADAQALDMAGANLDAAVCRLGLMFCTAPGEALREVRQALRPGGRFAALVFSSPEANPCVALTMRTARQHAGVPPADPFAPGSLLSLGRPVALARLLDGAGLHSIEVTPLAAPFRLPSVDDYMAFLRDGASPVIELLRGLPAARQAEAWADIAAQLGRFTTAHGWEGPNELLLCSGTRD
jgi:SAM-dependent methyltransferase